MAAEEEVPAARARDGNGPAGRRRCAGDAGGLSSWRSGRGDRGAALIEFAVMLPVMAILLFGVIDLGRAYHVKNQLKNAAREGAIYGRPIP